MPTVGAAIPTGWRDEWNQGDAMIQSINPQRYSGDAPRRFEIPDETATLATHHREHLQGSAISPDVIAERGYRTVTTKAELARLGFGRTQQNVPALLMPIHNTRGERVLYQSRPDEPRLKDGRMIKYETPAGAGLALDVPPRSRAQLDDPSVPLWITEGAKKADAGASHGLLIVALIGVYGFRHTNGHGGKVALPELQHIAWNQRKVYLAFDSDAMENPQVHLALSEFAALLTSLGANVRYVYLPSSDGRKVGLDDFLAAGGTVESMLQTATSDLRSISEEDADEDETEPEWEPSAEALAAGLALLDSPDVLDRATETIARLGVAGDLTNVRLLYLSGTSRVLKQPVNIAVIATSSAGKTHLVKTTFALFPARAFYLLDGASERALIYTDADLRQRMIIISEADSLPREGVGISAMRALAWGGRLTYATVVTSRSGPPQSLVIDKPGPTGLITTSTRPVDAELDTRMLALAVDESNAATRAIIEANASRRNGHVPDAPNLEPWQAAQWWLAEHGEHAVVIPFAPELGRLFPDDQVRKRRDWEQLCNLIEAAAVLHQRQRARDDQGRIVATLDDYDIVFGIASAVFGHIAAQGVTPALRRTVAGVGAMIEQPGATVTVTQLARSLNVDRSSIHRQVSRALDVGWLINEETRERRPARLRPGDPMPDDRPALPPPDELLAAIDVRAHHSVLTESTQTHPCESDAFSCSDSKNRCALDQSTPMTHPQHASVSSEKETHLQTPHAFPCPDAENKESVSVCPASGNTDGVHTLPRIFDSDYCRNCGSMLYTSRPGSLCRTCTERIAS